jgi:hypothetical protein
VTGLHGPSRADMEDNKEVNIYTRKKKAKEGTGMEGRQMIESSGNPVDKSYGMCSKSPMQQHSDTHSEDRASKAKVKA